MATGRARLSSFFAFVGAAAMAAFTVGASQAISRVHWSMWLVVIWSVVLSLGLFAWALRGVFGWHWIGNPTFAMVAGVSGSSITAVALAFTFAFAKEQDSSQARQLELAEAQVQSLKRMEVQLQSLPRVEEKLAAIQILLVAQAASRPPGKGSEPASKGTAK